MENSVHVIIWKTPKTSNKKSSFRLISSFINSRYYFHVIFQYRAINKIVSTVTLFGKGVPLSHFHQGFSLSASHSLTLLFALFSTPTVPPAQPLLRLVGFDKSGLGLVGLPQNPQISFHLYHPHSILSSSKSNKGCQFQRLVVCLRWVPTVRFWFGSVLGAHYFGCSKHFSKVVFLKFIFKKSICFLRVFLGNGKCNGCGIMLVISSKFGILWVLIKIQFLYCLHLIRCLEHIYGKGLVFLDRWGLLFLQTIVNQAYINFFWTMSHFQPQ